MKPEAIIHQINGQFYYEVVDMDDTVEFGGDVLPEHLFSSKKGYTRERSAETAATKAVAEFREASDDRRREMCGYSPSNQCEVARPDGRVGNRNTPVRPAKTDPTEG